MQIITLEGIDGSGKTTIYDALKDHFSQDNDVVFIKSPLSPFDALIKDFWESDKFDRFVFFVVANSHFSKKIYEKPDRVYVLDRFTFSTYVTHIASVPLQQKALMKQVIDQVEIVKPVKVFLVKASMPAIEQRLTERDNGIDNKLKADSAFFHELYRAYYENPVEDFGAVEMLNNENPEDLNHNIEKIKNEIFKCKSRLQRPGR